MANRFSIEAVFRAIDRVTAPVSKMQRRVRKFTRSMTRGLRTVNRAVSKVAGGLKRMGIIGGAALLSMVFAFGNVLAAGADFEQAITNVGAVTLQTRKEIEPLEKLALELGRTTKFTATQSADAMQIMARAGFKANEILSATPAVLAAAAASSLEIAEVAAVVSNALKGMGLETKEAARVADVLALASAKTKSTIGTLGESLKNVASTARQLGIPLEETIAAIALLQDVGLDASVAGSAFNVMLTKMAAPTKGMQRQMRRLGISFKDAKGDMKPLEIVLLELDKAAQQVGGNFDQVAFLAELVGLRGQKAAANLSKLAKEGRLGELTEQLKKAEGVAKKMAAIRMNTVRGSLLLLTSAVDAVKVKMFGLQRGPLKDVIDGMTKWVGINEDLIAGNVADFLGTLIQNLSNIWKWVKRIGIGLAVFFTFAAIVKTATIAVTAFNLAMMLNPMVLATIGVIALTSALTALLLELDLIQKIGGKVGEFVFEVTNLLGAHDIVDTNNILPSVEEKLLLRQKFLAKRDAQMVSPQERVARSIEEQRTTTSAEIKLTAGENTKAELVKGKLGTNLTLEPSGAM